MLKQKTVCSMCHISPVVCLETSLPAHEGLTDPYFPLLRNLLKLISINNFYLFHNLLTRIRFSCSRVVRSVEHLRIPFRRSHHLEEWFLKWRLPVNPAKCKCCLARAHTKLRINFSSLCLAPLFQLSPPQVLWCDPWRNSFFWFTCSLPPYRVFSSLQSTPLRSFCLQERSRGIPPRSPSSSCTHSFGGSVKPGEVQCWNWIMNWSGLSHTYFSLIRSLRNIFVLISSVFE